MLFIITHLSFLITKGGCHDFEVGNTVLGLTTTFSVGNIAARFVSLSFPHQTELLLMENR